MYFDYVDWLDNVSGEYIGGIVIDEGFYGILDVNWSYFFFFCYFWGIEMFS